MVFRTLEKLAVVEPPVRIILCAALIKFDHFEWMIEKATELGVAEIVPVDDRAQRTRTRQGRAQTRGALAPDRAWKPASSRGGRICL